MLALFCMHYICYADVVLLLRMLPEFAAAVRAALPTGTLADIEAALTSCLCTTLEPLTPFGVSFSLAKSDCEDTIPRKERLLCTLMSRLCVRSFEMLLLLRRNFVGTDGHISGQVSDNACLLRNKLAMPRLPLCYVEFL